MDRGDEPIGEKRKNKDDEGSCSKKSKDEEIETMCSQLLTKKEKLSEEFLNVLMSSLENKNEFAYSADLTFQERIHEAEKNNLTIKFEDFKF